MIEDDIGSYYRDLKQIKQAEHQQKSDEIVAKLKADGFEFRLMGNGQATIDRRFDIWTTTGSWFDRNSRQRGRGYATFKEHIEQTLSAQEQKEVNS